MAEPELKLYPHQEECLNRILRARERGGKRLMFSIATGGGKGTLIGQIPNRLGYRRVLVLVHREELVDQLIDEIRRGSPCLTVGKEMADHSADGSDVVVASVPTLGRHSSCRQCDGSGEVEKPNGFVECQHCHGKGTTLRRIRKWKPDHFECVVIDECHHGIAPSYLTILRYFGAGKKDGPLLLGCSATPFRGDGKELADLFDEVVYDKGIEPLILEGFLSPLRAIRVKSQSDISNIHTRMGDFAENELAKAANTDYRNSLIISAIEQHAADRRSILIFCVDVSHVTNLTEQLRRRGHNAAMVSASTPSVERYATIKGFRDGTLRILVNCGIATEGFDARRCDCVVMARPTKSPLLYAQILGRGTRTFPGKKDCLIIDVVDVCGKHRVMTAARMFGMRDVDLLGQDIVLSKQKFQKAIDAGVNVRDEQNIDQIERQTKVREGLAKGTIHIDTVAAAVDLFDGSILPEEVERDSIFPWHKVSEIRYSMSLPDRRVLSLYQNQTGRWTVTDGTNSFAAETISSRPPFVWADRVAKRFFRPFKTEDGYEIPGWKVKARNAKWRNEEASEKQRGLLRKLGIRILPPKLTRGAAADLLDYLFSMRKHM